MPYTPEQRRRLLYYFMSGDPKGKGEYKGQMRVWVAYLYNIPNDAIPNIIEKYISTHDTVDRAIVKTGGEKGLVHKLFYNEEFFMRLNYEGKVAFTEIRIEDVLSVLKKFCRLGKCSSCGTDFTDITELRSKGDTFFCTKCRGGIVLPEFPKLITISKMIAKHGPWFEANLRRVLGSLSDKYINVPS